MTAGQQGGSWGPSGEQPEGGSGQGGGYRPAPPPPTGYAPAPPPPAPGWPPAPPEWGPPPGAPPAPAAMERPQTVRAGLGALIAAMVLSLVAVIYQVANFNSLLDDALAAAQRNSSNVDAATARDLAHTVLVAGLVLGLVWLCLEAMFIWFAWRGRNWARVVLWVIAGLGVAFGLVGLLAGAGQPGFLRTLSLFQWLLTAAAIVLLALKPSNEWYRYRRWLRDTGQKG